MTTEPAENLRDPSRRRFVVVVGGWRPVAEFDSKGDAMAHAATCVSRVVCVRERTPGTYHDPNIPTLTDFTGDEEE